MQTVGVPPPTLCLSVCLCSLSCLAMEAWCCESLPFSGLEVRA